MSKRALVEPVEPVELLKERSVERAALRAHLYLSARALSFFQGSSALGGLSWRRVGPPQAHPALATLELEEASAPLGDPRGLTRECVVELSELIKRLTFTWLSELGVRRARYAHPQQGDVRVGRLWEHPAWARLALRFSAQSIDLLSALCASPDQPQLEQARGLLQGWRVERDGDLLFHLLCYVSLVERPGRSVTLTLEDHLSFARSPLALLCAPCELITHASLTHDQLVERLSVLCEPSLTTLRPWLSPLIVQAWLKQAHASWALLHRLSSDLTPMESADRALFFKRFHAQAVLFKALEEVAQRRGRLDLCTPLISYFTSLHTLWSQIYSQLQSQRGAELIEQLHRVLNDVLHSEREPLTRGLIEVMKGPARLARYAASVTRTHRFDREPSDNLFLSEYQASELERTLPLYAEITNALEPIVG